MTSKLTTYPEYKASGIDWLGDIPSHWKIVRTQYLFDIYSGSTPNSNEQIFWDGEIKWITPADFNTTDKYVSQGKRNLSQKGYNSCSTTLVPVGSIVFSKRAPIGKVCLTKTSLCTNQGCFTCVPKNVCVDYYYYLMSILEKIYNLYGSGSTFTEISAKDFSLFKLIVPSLAEQEVIAAYLDDVTGKVDALIAEKRKQVEDIRAYRTSLITETVTHGLNPDANLRPSGIDWLGNIPSHWKQCKLKHCAELVLGKMLQTQKPSSGDYSLEKYLKSRNVSSLSLSGLNNLDEMWFSDYEKCLYLLKEGDIVMNEGGEIGKVARWIPQSFDCYIQNSVHKITPNEALNSGYLEYYLFTIANIGYFNSIVSQISIAHLTKEKLSNTPVMVPPLAEQKDIADFLDAKIAKIDDLIGELTKQIDELTEYKQAVITEAVTGKVDVCDYKPLI